MQIDLLTHYNPIGKEIAKTLNSRKYSDFKIIVAYSRYSGIGRIYNELANFVESGGKISAIIGIDQSNTSYQALLNMKSFAKNRLFVCYHKNFSITFHPKIYLFGNKQIEKVFIGSSNLTTGGLYLNYEANVVIALNHSKNERGFQKQMSGYWKSLLNDENTKKCENSLLQKLLEKGLIFDESQHKSLKNVIEKVSNSGLPFKSKKNLKKLPPIVKSSVNILKSKERFAMTLSKFDVSKKSQDPVILIPIVALKLMPVFWHFPNFYTYSGAGYPQLYITANIHIDGEILRGQFIRIYYYDNKREFRLQCEVIKRKGRPGDIMIIKKCSHSTLEFDIELLRNESQKFKTMRPLLTHKVSLQKYFAYY